MPWKMEACSWKKNQPKKKNHLVEDFPTDLILKIMAEEEVLLQDDRLKTISHYHPSSSRRLLRLFEKKR
ncbi:AIF_collapsed_G0031990.mRNA.1.CDS.1 [Saccharomyces cerevisiae]|nr:AIF_collapsed_G0031990.mRNA.1.CDS.1 [Saccharomyces cerevisiae]